MMLEFLSVSAHFQTHTPFAENEIYVGRGLSDRVDVAFPDNYRGGGGGGGGGCAMLGIKQLHSQIAFIFINSTV